MKDHNTFLYKNIHISFFNFLIRVKIGVSVTEIPRQRDNIGREDCYIDR